MFYLSMNISANNISFTSKINFVNASEFQRVKNGTFIGFRTAEESLRRADEFYLENVRTCAGGCLVNTKTREAAGFHFYDSEDRIKRVIEMLKETFESIRPDKCILFGGNNLKCGPFSMKQFEIIKNFIEPKVEKMTVFEEHLFPYAETNFHYSAKNDVCNIHSMYRPNYDYKEHDLLTRQELPICFRNVVISPDDELIFHNVK